MIYLENTKEKQLIYIPRNETKENPKNNELKDIENE